ncbi:SprB repeat-containing protein, partial [uncultured Arcticibacterium sp.]|uniref:SprB repeat-containing protein n=1 Tax=uncultured Arcticibacterium sp. TaxID=2173042 RepID=UPI0030F8B2CB
MSKLYANAYLKKINCSKLFFAVPFLFVFLAINIELSAQCTVGSTSITWQGASSGSQTVIPTSGSAGGPPSAVTDQVAGCTSSQSVNPFDFKTTISDPDGVYDARRSGTSGIYGSGMFSLTLDNFDNGCGGSSGNGNCSSSNNAAYSPGDEVVVTFDFEYPVLISELLIVDIDQSDFSNPPAGQSSFQDRVTLSAIGADGGNAPLNLSMVTNGTVTISGQTATANWQTGVDNGVAPTDGRGQLRVSSSTAVKSLTLRYIAGPNDPNPAQQAIAITNFNVCCPRVVNISGNVFADCESSFDGTVNGTGLGNPSGTALYANVVEPVSNTVVGSALVNNNGTYNVQDIPSNDTYQIVLSTTQGTFGVEQGAAPSASLPPGWNFIAENLGSGSGSDGTGNGVLTSVVVNTSNVSNANFEINRPIIPSATPTAALCNGDNGSAALSATGGVGSYTFTSSGGTVSGSTLTAPAGTYTITATDGISCTGTTSVTISEPAMVDVSAAPTEPLCNGGNGSAALSATGGNSSYTFTSSGGTVSGSTLTAPAGTYTITATDGNSCTGTTTVTITEPAALSASLSYNNVVCNGESTGNINVTVTGGTGPYTFSWTRNNVATGHTGQNYLNIPEGDYRVFITDDNGCTTSRFVEINEPAAIVAAATATDALCNGADGSAALSATGGNSTYTFTSSGGTVAGSTLTAPAGTYTITATDGNSCTGTTTVTINEPAAIVAAATATDALCNGANGSAALSA